MITVQNLCKTYKVAKRKAGMKEAAAYFGVNMKKFTHLITSVFRLRTERQSAILAQTELVRVLQLRYSAAF